MGEQSQLDIDRKSALYTFTPSLRAKRLPLFAESCGHFYAKRQYLTQRDGIDSYLMFYTIAGSGYLRYGDEEYTLGPRSVAVIDCRVPHLYRTLADTWTFKWIHFDGPSAAEYYRILTEHAPVFPVPDDSGLVETYMDSIPLLLTGKGMHADVKASTSLVNLFSALIEEKTDLAKIPSLHRHDIGAVLAHIENNYRGELTIDDFTAIIHMSKFHFVRTFKKHMGAAPYEYLINYRVNQSKTLLKETTLSIDEISHRTGFGNCNNFIRHFKNAVGTTPARYRRHWAE